MNFFFETLKVIYNSKKLQMDSEITRLLCVARLALRELKDDVYLYDQRKNIKCAPKIKILGWHLNQCLNYDSTINQQVTLVENTIISLQPK